MMTSLAYHYRNHPVKAVLVGTCLLGGPGTVLAAAFFSASFRAQKAFPDACYKATRKEATMRDKAKALGLYAATCFYLTSGFASVPTWVVTSDYLNAKNKNNALHTAKELCLQDLTEQGKTVSVQKASYVVLNHFGYGLRRYELCLTSSAEKDPHGCLKIMIKHSTGNLETKIYPSRYSTSCNQVPLSNLELL